MKRLFILLLCMVSLVTFGQIPADTGQIRQKTNEWLVPNGNKAITAQQVNALFNGVLNLMKAYAVDSGYVQPGTDTLVLVRRGGFSSFKIKLPSGPGGIETDPTVPTVVKSISSLDINNWNSKQSALSYGSGAYITDGNKVHARIDSALWNARKLQGNPISTTAPTNGQVLKWNGSAWAPAPCGCDVIAPALSIATQPVGNTVNTGASFSLTVAVTGGVEPYIYNWYKAGIATSINSPTLTDGDAQSGDDADYYVKITDAAGTILNSNTVHVTVTATIPAPSVTVGYSTSDPFVNSSTAPTISNSTTITITSGANIQFSLPAAAGDKYWVVRVPIAQPVATAWYHNTDNSGPIPGDVVRTWTVGSFRYYSSVSEFVLTYTDPIQLTH